MITFILSFRSQACDIAASARLCNSDRQNVLTRYTLGQPAFLLLFGTKLADVRPNKTVVQCHEESSVAVAYIFLNQHLLVAKIGYTCSAVFFIGPHKQQALFSGFAESFAIDNSLLMPLVAVRLNFLLHEPAN